MKLQEVQTLISKKITELEVIANSNDDIVNASAAKVYITEMKELLCTLEFDEDEDSIVLVDLKELVAEKNSFTIEDGGFFYKLAYVASEHKFNLYIVEF